jgi:putative FmdB family regulatory protein
MPIWDYTCSNCGHEGEEITKGSDLLLTCPKCGKSTFERQYTKVPGYRDKDFFTRGGKNALIYRDLNTKYKKLAKHINRKNGHME